LRTFPAFSLLGLALASFLFVAELYAQSPVAADKTAKVESVWRLQEFMVPMRDGVHLQTVVITRKDQTNALPILLRRTPYGVPTQDEFDKSAAKDGADWMPANWKELDVYPEKGQTSVDDLPPARPAAMSTH
jgi:predicted acyl esterase